MTSTAFSAPLTTILVVGEGFTLDAWQIGAIAFAFVGVVLLVTTLFERWEVSLHD